MPSRGDEEWMRTDLRLFHLDRFQLPMAERRPRDRNRRALPDALLTHGVESGRLDAWPRWPRRVRASWIREWAERGVLFGSLDALVVRAWRSDSAASVPGDESAFRQVCRAARGLLAGGTLLYVPRAWSIDQPFHTLSALRPAASIWATSW